jgi:dihydrofolate reductase
MINLEIIAAVDYKGGFTRKGKIPWYFKKDFQHFKNTTTGHICIMGRKTYEDILRIVLDREDKHIQQLKQKEKNQYKKWDIEYNDLTTTNLPRVNITSILPNRKSFVITRNKNAIFAGADTITSIREATYVTPKDKTLFIIGGERLFTESIQWAHTVHLTIVKNHHQCNKFFPIDYLHKNFNIISGREENDLYFTKYKRKK